MRPKLSATIQCGFFSNAQEQIAQIKKESPIRTFLFGYRCAHQQPSVEYHAAADIYHREDIKSEIQKYSDEETRVVPLAYSLIEDEAYIDRILPGYTDLNIHCLIWAQTPEWNRFFLEDGDTQHTYIELSEEALLESLRGASQEDQERFWLNFRPKIDLENYFTEASHHSH